MIRTVRAAMKSANSASTPSTIRPSTGSPPGSFADERGGAPDLHHVHAPAGLDDRVLVVGARGPDLAVQPHAAGAVADGLDDGGRAPHERRRVRPQLGGGARVATGDGTQGREHDDRDGEE